MTTRKIHIGSTTAAVRDVFGLSIQEAKQFVMRRSLLNKVDDASSIDDLKEILSSLIKRQMGEDSHQTDRIDDFIKTYDQNKM